MRASHPGASTAVPPPSVPARNHIAVLQPPDTFDCLRRKDDLLDDGVHSVFGIRGEEAILHALIFQAGKFSAAAAHAWLGDRGWQPVQFGELSAFVGER